MTIALTIKNVYGRENIYVQDEDQKCNISALTGKKTISRSDIKALEALGFTFEVLAPQL